jgi:subtilisin family serine protease
LGKVKSHIRLLILFILLSLANSGLPQGVGLKGKEYVPGEILIKFKKGSSYIHTKSLLQQIKGQQIQEFPFIKVQHIKVPSDHRLQEYLELLRSDPLVEYAEPNYIIRIARTPDDPDFNRQWGLHNTGQDGGTPDADIDAPEAWDIQTESSSIVIAVIDSGINYIHEDLRDNIWTNPNEIPDNGVDDDGNGLIDDFRGWDFVNNDNDPLDDNGHGTHVAGIIAAVGNNNKGIAGVNWTAKIMPLKTLNGDGEGTTSAAISAIQYAIDKGAKVLNNSWGSDNFSQALLEAIIASNKVGTLFVAAAGNDSRDADIIPEYPANYEVPNIIAVAATTRNDVLASFSNYGATTVHVAAPGQSIYSTYIPLISSYHILSGTSQATPYVSGLAALVWSKTPSMSNIEVKYNIMATSDPLNFLEDKIQSRGRINAFKALTCSPSTLALFNDSLGRDFLLEVGESILIKVSLTTQCGSYVTQADVKVSFSNDPEILSLYDDGEHNDGAQGDGVYANTWSPRNQGTTTLVITASKNNFAPITISVSGEVIQNYNMDDTISFEWIDATSGKNTGIKTDEGSVEVDIGFNFTFFNNIYSRVRIDANGYLSFDLPNDPEEDYQNRNIPDFSLPNSIIAPFWDDLDLSQQGDIFYLLSGSPPERIFTIEWYQVPHIVSTDGNILGTVTFEVSLYEATGEIIFQYQDVSFDDPRFDQGASATVGIEHSSGRIGRLYSYNTNSLKEQLAIRFYQPMETPIANAGPDQVVPTGVSVTLDGSASFDPGGQEIFYNWSMVSKPNGSAAAIADKTKEITCFKADLDGLYRVKLVVNNGEKESSPDTVTIRALGGDLKIQVVPNKEVYQTGDLLELYLWLGNGVSEPKIEQAKAFIGFIFPDGQLFFLDGAGNLTEGNPADTSSFTPIAEGISLLPAWVFPESDDMDADSDKNGKVDTYRLFSASLPPIVPGKYYAFAALAKTDTTTRSLIPIGEISLVSFSFSN